MDTELKTKIKDLIEDLKDRIKMAKSRGMNSSAEAFEIVVEELEDMI